MHWNQNKKNIYFSSCGRVELHKLRRVCKNHSDYFTVAAASNTDLLVPQKTELELTQRMLLMWEQATSNKIVNA